VANWIISLPRQHLRIALLWLVVLGLMRAPSTAQDLLNDDPQYSPFQLELRPYATLPQNDRRIIGMITRSGDARLYVTTEGGRIYTISADGAGTPTEWFDVASAASALGHPLEYRGSQTGLQSVAFHPDFDRSGLPGYGKFYTTMLEQRPASSDGDYYLGDSVHGDGVAADGVLVEWTYDHEAGQVDANSYRELFRVNMPWYDHPIKQAKFNPYARPGDEDYGLLYVTHGDSNIKDSPNDDPQHPTNALGKMLRINPLPSDGDRYVIPPSNPFAGSSDPSVLQEIYAFGLRNPHTFSFNPDDAGIVHFLAGDIGRNNVEEVDLIVPGGNYGWPKREGTFVHLQLPNSDPDAGYISGVAALPSDEAMLGYTFPVAQFDHNASVSQVTSGNAIASGFVIRNGSDPNLQNQFIFANFANHDGIVYHTDFDEMLSAVTEIDADPGELTQAELHKLRLALDHDNDPDTPPQIYDDFQSLLNWPRSDTRFGEGVFGEMYISSKINGTIYLVTNSLPLPGDYNRDGVVDAADYVVWRQSLGAVGYRLAADGNGNGAIDSTDYDVWRANFGQTAGGWGFSEIALLPESATLVLLQCAVVLVCLSRSMYVWQHSHFDFI
jgi:hypothetical protein